MKAIHIFHHNDADGIVAASLMYEYVKKYRKDIRKTIFHMVNYEGPLSFDEIPSNDTIAILDYAPLDSVVQIISEIKNLREVIYIDHHKTSVTVSNLITTALFGDIPATLNMLISQERCGAWLTYEWCVNRIATEIPELTWGVEMEVPELIKYVDAHDRWLSEYPDHQEFNYGFCNLDPEPKTFLKDILDHPVDIFNWKDEKMQTDCKHYVARLIYEGTPIRKSIANSHEHFARHNAFQFTIIDMTQRKLPKTYKCYGVNAYAGSEALGWRYDEADIVSTFSFTGKEWKFSFYSKHQDGNFPGSLTCEDIARLLSIKYGDKSGGGHACAAGCTLRKPVLLKNCAIVVTKWPILGYRVKVIDVV